MKFSEENLYAIRNSIQPYKIRSPSKGSSEAGAKNSPKQNGYFHYLIRDVLSQIRRGNIDYVFTKEHVIELLRYEPNAKIKWDMTCDCFVVYM